MTDLALLYEPATVQMVDCDKREANDLLTEWKHPLGPCERPFHQEQQLLLVAGEPVALTVSASTVSSAVGTHRRTEVVELARIARAPGARWAMRPALRLWRAVFAQRWETWDVVAAYSYSLPGYSGDIYRFDGWEMVKVCKPANPGKGSTWSKSSATDQLGDGKKKLWRYVFDPLESDAQTDGRSRSGAVAASEQSDEPKQADRG